MTDTTVEQLPDRLLMRGGSPGLVGKELISVIAHAISQHPRTLQVRIGPSEIGNPCARRIGYKLLLAPSFNLEQAVSWKPFIGTAVHEKLERIFDAFNNDPTYGDTPRFYIETRVPAGWIDEEVVDGSCDLYDRVTCGVIDWKVVGPTQLKKYKKILKPGVRPTDDDAMQYHTQAHAYGAGWVRLGLPVDYVMIVFLPRNGELSDTHIWYETFDQEVADAGFQRAQGIKTTVDTLGIAGLDVLPFAEAYCFRCPYYVRDSQDLRHGCPGFPTEPKPYNPPITLKGKPA